MRINIEVDDSAVRTAFNRLVAAGGNLSPLLRDVGERLTTTTKRRFNEGIDPDGNAWTPLSEVTKTRKKRNRDKILVQDRYLRDSIVYQLDGNNALLIGSSRIYASTHQFGAAKGAFGSTKRGAPIPWGDIPARPYLGLSSDDRRDIQAIVSDYITDTAIGL